jgi:hypothetical protein
MNPEGRAVMFGVGTKSDKRSWIHLAMGIIVLACMIAATIMLFHRFAN